MRQKLIRTVILICVSALIMTAGAGCEKKGTSDVDSGGGSKLSDSQESVKTALKYEPNEELDFGGKELTISVWGGVVEEGTDEFFDRRYALERRTEDRYNVKIEWVPTDTSTFIQDVTLAYTSGKKFADLMFVPSSYAFDLCKVGAVLPLDDYIDYDSSFYSLTADNLRYVDGKHYSYMPDDLSVNNLGYYITYNNTLLNQAGCEDPMQLYENGKWDWDALKEIINKTTVIESGETVQYGIGASNLLDALCISNGFSMITMDTENHKFECGLYSDAGLNVLNYVREIGYTMKGTDGNYGGHNSKITFGDSKTAMLICPAYYAGEFVIKGMDVSAVPMPKGPDAKGYTNGLDLQEWWCVNAATDFDIKELLQVALDMNDNDPQYEDTYLSYDDKVEMFKNRMYDGALFTTEEEADFFRDYVLSEDVETILNISCNDIRDTIVKNVFGPIIQGQDPRSVLETVEPVINTALENMLPESLK